VKYDLLVSDSATLPPRSVLLVDDDEGVHERIRLLVTRLGMGLLSAFNAPQAREMTRTPGIDLIVLDVTLEHPHDGVAVGAELLEEIDLPIIFLTASDDEDTMTRLSAVTHYGVILKSSSSFVITESIRMAFRLFDAHRRRIEQESRYRALVESIQDFVVIHDPDGLISFANRYCEEILQLPRDEIVGRHINTVLGGDYLVRSQLRMREMGTRPERGFSLKSFLTAPDGRLIVVSVKSAALFAAGEYGGELVVARDISQSEADRIHVEEVNRLLFSIREIHQVLIRTGDPQELIQRTCDVLVTNNAYSSAWIILEPGAPEERRIAGAAGLVESGAELLSILGDAAPACAPPHEEAETDVAVFLDPTGEFPGCPLNSLYADQAVLVAALRFDEDRRGVMGVTVEREVATDGDAQQIFLELSADIAFGLHSIHQRLLRSQAEADALKLQRRLQTFFAHSPMSVITLDTAGRFLSSNPYFQDWTGYGDEELAGTDFRSIVARRPTQLDAFFDRSDPASQPALRIALPFRKQNGKAVWGQGVIVPVPGEDQDQSVLIVVLADTTRRKVAEQRLNRAHSDLKRSESRYRSLFENSADMVFVSAHDGTLLDINGAGARTLGYNVPEEIIGRDVRDFYFNPEDRGRFIEEIAGQGMVKNLEVVLKRRDGIPVFGSESATLVQDTDAPEPIYQGVIHDITERIRSEQESIQRSMELSQANEELRRAQDELVKKEKLASIGQLSAGVAHEINNPLGFVRSNLATLRRYVDRYLPFLQSWQQLDSPPAATQEIWEANRIAVTLPEVESLFDETEDGIQRIVAIVTNLKDFSRAGSNEVMDNYDINGGVKSSLVIARNEYKYVAEIEVRPGDVPPVMCNANEVNQVILTLLVNASQALRQMGGTGGRITITTGTDDGGVFCSVADNGPGIPAAIRHKVFEPFFTTKKAGEGTGLGLSIAYDIIVNRHAGTMTLESEEGRGTTFTFHVPGRSQFNE
jgi:two-component system, NtrC family, sensor kinase